MKKVVGVQLENDPKIYFFLVDGIHLIKEDEVIVETEQGIQIGKVKTFVKEYEDRDVSTVMKKVLRKVTPEDLIQQKQNQKDSMEALETAKKLALELDLPMQFLDANYIFNRNQLFFSYLADTRIDFRILAKKLASKYKTRIELRQIGVRDKAKKVGGLGPCGLILCCNRFLDDFVPVSINMAKNQDLALNPTKINGLCGRLLCCLNYEDELYKELREKMPKIGEIITTAHGKGKVVSINLLNHTYYVELSNKEVIAESV